MAELGGPEILVILVLIVLLFGVGRLGKIGGEVGKSIREFRLGLRGDEPAGPNASSDIKPDSEK